MKISILVLYALTAVVSVASATAAGEEAEFQTYHLLGKLDQVTAGKKYRFHVDVDEKAPGWALLLDPFPFEHRKNLAKSAQQRWARSGVNTAVHVELTSKSNSIIDVAESPPPFSSDSVEPGETLSLTLKDFSHQMVIRKLRGTAPGPERIEFDVALTFDEDIDWPGGIHLGVVYVAEMHKHPEWFHISTRQRNWKKSEEKSR